MISRRELLLSALALTCGVFFPQRRVCAESTYPHFFFTQLRYRGGAWDPNPQFVEAMVEELELRTSIDAAKERRVMDLSDADLFFSPFLFMAGKYEFEPFTPQARGGFLCGCRPQIGHCNICATRSDGSRCGRADPTRSAGDDYYCGFILHCGPPRLGV